MFKVLDGGFQTTIQDLGRLGYLGVGIPPSGAQDPFALRVGNLLVGNDAGDYFLSRKKVGDAGLEATLLGPKLEVLLETVVAVTGADLNCKLNGEPMPLWRAIRVRVGDVISFGGARLGARAYVTVAGGIDVPPYLGSRSTYLQGFIGGIEGRQLKKGDTLKTGKPRRNLAELDGRMMRPECIPTYTRTWEVRTVLGPDTDRFADESVEVFFKSEWKLSSRANRMGMRLIGPKLEFKPKRSELVRYYGPEPWNIGVVENAPCGCIQVPGGIEPIVLGVDGISLGGYARIATAISLDMSRIGQARPGEIVKFKAVTTDEAVDLLRENEGMISERNVRIG